jgi:hypothetical protein
MPNCAQCGRPAVFSIEMENGSLPLCIDCNLKFEQAEAIVFDRRTRVYNHKAQHLQMSMGIPIPRIPPSNLPVFYYDGGTVLNNINLKDSAVGVLNTGSIQSIDAAVTVMNRRGDQVAAAAIARMVEAIASETNLDDKVKADTLEKLSIVASEATLPKEKRRGGAIRSLLVDVSQVVGGVAGLAQLWQTYGPLIEEIFR